MEAVYYQEEIKNLKALLHEATVKKTAKKTGRPRRPVLPAYDKWGMLKVKDSERKYVLPQKAIIVLPNGVEVSLGEVAKGKKLLSLIRAAKMGVKTEKRQVKLLPNYNNLFNRFLREFKPNQKAMVYHESLGVIRLGKEIYKYVDDLYWRKKTSNER